MQAFRFNRLRRGFALAGHIAEDDHGPLLRLIDRRQRDDIKLHKPMLWIGDFYLASHQLAPLIFIQIENEVPMNIPQITLDRCALYIIEFEAQKLFGRTVRITNLRRRIEYNNPLFQGLENGLHQPLFFCKAKEIALQAPLVQMIEVIHQLIKKSRFHTRDCATTAHSPQPILFILHNCAIESQLQENNILTVQKEYSIVYIYKQKYP